MASQIFDYTHRHGFSFDAEPEKERWLIVQRQDNSSHKQ